VFAPGQDSASRPGEFFSGEILLGFRDRIRKDFAMYEVSDDVVSGHALAARWKVRTYLLREIARATLPGLQVNGRRERYYLGPDEQRALRDVLLVIDRERARQREPA
jgi:hypothetical protein